MRVLSCPRPLAVTSLAVGMLSGNHPSTTPAPARRKRVTSNLYGVSMTAPVKKNPSGRAIRAEFVRAGSDHLQAKSKATATLNTLALLLVPSDESRWHFHHADKVREQIGPGEGYSLSPR